MGVTRSKGLPNNFDEYKDYVALRESHLADYATKSEKAILFDGTSSDQYYQDRFANAEDRVTLDRNRFRTLFQIDRDRILYSSYFLRLAKKTQIFTSRDSLVETRLSHTTRVAQIARSLSMGLRLNQDLAEAMALGHDIGHVPFAHIGESSLRSWLNERIGISNIKLRQGDLFGAFRLPILSKIREDLHDAVQSYFTFGNDSKEELFMHGRQSFRLLAIKYKEGKRAKFTRQVLFGIWRHSLSVKDTDNIFQFKTIGPEGSDCSISTKDLTPECQTVRYADDISTIIDLVEGMKHGFITPREIHDALDGYTPDEDYLGGSIPQLFYDLSGANVPRLLTYFISDFIRTNLDRLEQGLGAEKMSLSERAEHALKILRAVTKDKLHGSIPLSRGDRISEARIRALCDWYDSHPDSLITDMKTKMEGFDFQYRFAAEDEKRVQDSGVFRYATICDFISLLTDEEVRKLSEPL